MTAGELAKELRELKEKATPAPWVAAKYGKKTWGIGCPGDTGGGAFFRLQCVHGDCDSEDNRADGTLLLVLRNHLPAILVALEDADLLDWMQANHASALWGGVIKRREGYRPDAVYIEWKDGESIAIQSGRFETLREALREARAARGGEEL